MPKIDIATALAWAKERFPSPVVRRPVDDLLAHCPRVEGELMIQCKDCPPAYWLDIGFDDAAEGMWQCSACGQEFYFGEGNPLEYGAYYCPSCGTKMDGGG